MAGNNPAGTNSPVAFDRFTRQIPYGEKKVQGDLQRLAPLAGESAAASPINAPRRARRAATRPAPTPVEQQPLEERVAPPPQPHVPTAAETWQAIAASPGAENFPILAEYASRV